MAYSFVQSVFSTRFNRDLVYAAQTGDTLSYVASGTQDPTGTTAGNTAGFITLTADIHPYEIINREIKIVNIIFIVNLQIHFKIK